MCGVVAVLPAPPPDIASNVLPLVRKIEDLRVKPLTGRPGEQLATAQTRIALAKVSELLASPEPERQMLTDAALTGRIRSAASRLQREIDEAERRLHILAEDLESPHFIASQRELTHLAAAVWSLQHDRLSRVDTIAALFDPRNAPAAATTGYGAIETALRSLDRMERRGPASTVLHVRAHGPQLKQLLDSERPEVKRRRRSNRDPCEVTLAGSSVTFSYTIATLNAQAGDNVTQLREVIAGDTLLGQVLTTADAQVSVLGCSHLPGLRAPHGTSVPPAPRSPMDDDASTLAVIDSPMLEYEHGTLRLSAHNAASQLSSFTRSVASSAGPFAVAAHNDRNPDTLLLAVRGPGPGLCVGLAHAGWIVTTQPCGLVGDASRYLRITGALSCDGKPAGAVVSLERDKAGELSGLRRCRIDGTPHQVRDSEIETTVISSFDVPMQLARSHLAR